MSIDPPNESGLYVVEESFPIEGYERIILRLIDINIPGVRVADINDNRIGSWDHFNIVRYRKIDLKELLDGPQPSGVPDRPGWWRFVSQRRGEPEYPMVVKVFRGMQPAATRVLHTLIKTPHYEDIVDVREAKGTWHGRVEMPITGERQ